MRILITNDDGVDSPGIHELAIQIEAAGYEAIVVAPDHDASGTGTSVGLLTVDRPIAVTDASIAGFAGKAYGVAGPPAMCVLAGYMGAFGPPPDIIVSGINAGLNPGRAVTHSGTAGAALAGQNFGMRSIAVSVDYVVPWQWSTAAELTVAMLPHLAASAPRVALNLNVPALPSNEIKGVRWASLAPYGSIRGTMVRRGDELIYTQEPTGYEAEDDTDLGAVKAGYASLTSLQAAAEVWSGDAKPGVPFHPGHGMPAAFAGHEIRASRATFIPSRYDAETYMKDGR